LEQEQLTYYQKELSRYLNADSVPKELEWFISPPVFSKRKDYFISEGVSYLIKAYHYGHFIVLALSQLNVFVSDKEYFVGCILFLANNTYHTMYCRIIKHVGRNRALYEELHYGDSDAPSVYVFVFYYQNIAHLCLQSEFLLINH